MTGLGILIIIILLVVIALIVVLLVPNLFASDSSAATAQLTRIVRTQRAAAGMKESEDERFIKSAEKAQVSKLKTCELNLQKRLRFARWKIPPIAYYLLVLLISISCYYLVGLKFNKVLTLFSLLTGPLFMSWTLNFRIDRRFKAFDADFPAFLSSLVSLLKVGQNPITAVKAAVETFSDRSMVKFEVNLMLDRLRLGVSEEQSIGAFAEDIYHPEIELFVQALLLSRKVGGNLSDTLDRLAQQVRKRQYFRNSAVAAVGMQRGSIAFILAIMASLQLYIFYTHPEAIMKGIQDETGWQVWQAGIILILLGIYWIRQVTKIRV